MNKFILFLQAICILESGDRNVEESDNRLGEFTLRARAKEFEQALHKC